MSAEQPGPETGETSVDYASLLTEQVESTKEADVSAELENLIGAYIDSKAERGLSNEGMSYVHARAEAMREVLASDELKQGKSLSAIVDERQQKLSDAAQKIKAAHGPLKGASYVQPEWDAASDLPKGTGRLEPGETYPAEVLDQLDDIYTQETALLALREVAGEVTSIKDGSNPTWNRPGDLEGDAKISLIATLDKSYVYPFSWRK